MNDLRLKVVGGNKKTEPDETRVKLHPNLLQALERYIRCTREYAAMMRGVDTQDAPLAAMVKYAEATFWSRAIQDELRKAVKA